LDTPGYTLLESLIAISIFLILMVPLTARLHEADKTARVRHKTTAMCILEQEAALIRHGESPFPVKKRTVAGREWVVETSAEGNPLRTYRMHAFLDGREISEVVFHNYEE